MYIGCVANTALQKRIVFQHILPDNATSKTEPAGSLPLSLLLSLPSLWSLSFVLSLSLPFLFYLY